MRVKIAKSKNAESFYIIKSYRNPKSGKSTSKIVEKLGTKVELKERLGESVDIMGWAKEHPAKTAKSYWKVNLYAISA